MKALLKTMAIIEITTGVALLAVPALVASILLGAALNTPAGLVLGALAVACWLARHDVQTRAGHGVLAYGGMGLGFSGIGLWPAVLLTRC